MVVAIGLMRAPEGVDLKGAVQSVRWVTTVERDMD